MNRIAGWIRAKRGSVFLAWIFLLLFFIVSLNALLQLKSGLILFKLPWEIFLLSLAFFIANLFFKSQLKHGDQVYKDLGDVIRRGCRTPRAILGHSSLKKYGPKKILDAVDLLILEGGLIFYVENGQRYYSVTDYYINIFPNPSIKKERIFKWSPK